MNEMSKLPGLSAVLPLQSLNAVPKPRFNDGTTGASYTKAGFVPSTMRNVEDDQVILLDTLTKLQETAALARASRQQASFTKVQVALGGISGASGSLLGLLDERGKLEAQLEAKSNELATLKEALANAGSQAEADAIKDKIAEFEDDIDGLDLDLARNEADYTTMAGTLPGLMAQYAFAVASLPAETKDSAAEARTVRLVDGTRETTRARAEEGRRLMSAADGDQQIGRQLQDHRQLLERIAQTAAEYRRGMQEADGLMSYLPKADADMLRLKIQL